MEPANYPLAVIPSDVDVPIYIEKVFSQFYRAMVDKVLNGNGIALEYAWDMQWCDPCATDPLSRAELQELGVGWLDPASEAAGENVYVTRLHAQYSKGAMAEDVMFTETRNRENFQGRYVMNQPADSEYSCDEAKDYIRNKKAAMRAEAAALADMTGWSRARIDKEIRLSVPAALR